MKEFATNVLCLIGSMSLTWALLTAAYELAYYIK